MSRFGSYFGIVAALIVGVLAIAAANLMPLRPAVPAATTTIAIPALEVEDSGGLVVQTPAHSSPVQVASSSAPTSESTAPSVVTPRKVTTPVAPQPPAPSAPPTQAAQAVAPAATAAPQLSVAPSGNASLDATATALRKALVNIMCYAPADSGLRSISGSGILIDAKGIILTNAHIAQYFLFADKGVSCTIRAGSPAVDAYKAALIYISPAWVRANAAVVTQVSPIGTGEYDFALVGITSSATSAALPATFPSVPFARTPPQAGAPVVIASFGAQFLSTSQIQSSLFPTIVFGSVKDVFTFKTNTIDVFSLGGSAAAQEGSSGGGVADASGALVGTITTSTIEGATATRTLSAITASYIRAEYATEMGEALDALLSQSISTSVSEFASQIPMLEAIITANL